MPTPKQVRYHYGKCSKLFDKLSDALIAAHNSDVIVYKDENYGTEGPCHALGIALERFNLTTKEQLFKAMRSEIWDEQNKSRLQRDEARRNQIRKEREARRGRLVSLPVGGGKVN